MFLCVIFYFCACVCVYLPVSPACFNLHPSAGGPPLPVQRPAVPRPICRAWPHCGNVCVCLCVCVCVCVCVGCLMSPVPYEVVSLKRREGENGWLQWFGRGCTDSVLQSAASLGLLQLHCNHEAPIHTHTHTNPHSLSALGMGLSLPLSASSVRRRFYFVWCTVYTRKHLKGN